MKILSKVWDAVLALCSGVMVILVCNPISMFVFNLVAPENAARFVYEFIGFNDFWRKFYTKSALKWPYWWSREWITLDNLKQCSVRKQINYYLTNLNRSQIIKAMSSEAQLALFKKNPDRVQEIIGLMRLTDEMFAEWLKKVIEYDHQHCSDIMEMRFYQPFNKYLEQGKLPFLQVMLLTKAVVEEKNAGIYEGLMYDLYDYIERFGLTEKQLRKVAQYMCDNLSWHDAFAEEPKTELAKEFEKQKKFDHFYNTLNERQINHDQRVFTRSQRGAERTDEWKAFCENTKYICVAAQKEMDIEQYKIFHATGHTLSAEVIKYFLNYPNRNLHRLVFCYEPDFGIADDDIREFVNNNSYLRHLLDTAVIAPVQEDLYKRIRNCEELTKEQLNKMFDCPDAAQMALDYVTYYPLPKAFHKRMLEPENDGVLQFYISQGWGLDTYQLDEAVAEECKRRGYRLDPPEDD